MRKIKNQKGITLIEMLIYMGLLSILLVVLTDMFASILDLKAEAEASSSVDLDSRYVFARMVHDINRANSITTPRLGSSGNTLVVVIDGESYTYNISSGVLQLTNSLGTGDLISSETSVSDLNFTRVGDTVRIEFTISSITQRDKGIESKDFVTTVGIR